MFVQSIVVPNFADCLCGILPSIGGHGSGVDSSRILRLFLEPVSSEISDFTSCTHAQSNILHAKYADKTDY